MLVRDLFLFIFIHRSHYVVYVLWYLLLTGLSSMSCSLFQIELENFKSYKGHHVLGPFRRFQCIIGANGSGKSNCMDAISFALGVQSKALRGGSYKDFIYRSENETLADIEKEKRVARATIVLDVNDYTLRPDGVPLCRRYSRTINHDGSCYAMIDGKKVSLEQYGEDLKGYDILIKSLNFLIFQGDVENVSTKNSMELTFSLEESSGSLEFKKPMDLLENEIKSISDELRFLNGKRTQMDETRRDLNAQLAVFEQWTVLNNKFKSKKSLQAAYKIHVNELNQSNIDERRCTLDQQVQDLNKEVSCILEIVTKN